MNKNKVFIIGLAVLIILSVILFIFWKIFFLPQDKVLVIKDQRMPEQQQISIQNQFSNLKDRIAKDSGDYDAWIEMGLVKKTASDYIGAEQAWQKAGELRQQNSLSFFNLGDLYTNFLNNPDKAEQSYIKALANDSTWVDVYTNLSDLYRFNFTDKKDVIEKLLADGLKNTNNDSNLLAYTASYYRDIKDYSQAIKYFEELSKVKPDDQTIKDELVRLRGKL